MRQFGLIGFPLGHSFSKKYFTEKFARMGLTDHQYDLFEMESLGRFPSLWEEHPDLIGVNVTVPHKENVIPYLTRLDESAEKVGAVNVIKKVGKELVGYNSDFYGFRQSLMNDFLVREGVSYALVLGTGGASKAVEAALTELKIPFRTVSRDPDKGDLTYREIMAEPQILSEAGLIVNTTPLGMHPRVTTLPELPYGAMHGKQYLYDLVYNPEETAFMKAGREQGAKAKNGLEMLYLQADRAWEIWNS